MRIAGAKVAIALCLVLSAVVSTAQSLGDVARQDRDRRAQLTQHSRVLTNEDLQQEKILPITKPEADLVASHVQEAESIATSVPAQQQPSASVLANTPLWGVAEQPGFSLGAYARTLRQNKTRLEQENAAVKQPVPRITNETLAEILPSSAEIKRSEENQKAESQPAQSHAAAIDPGRPLIRTSRGDSLWRLARIHLGDGRLWPVLWESNPEIRNPQRLVVGQLLRLPVQELNFARIKMNDKRLKVVMAKKATVQPGTNLRTASAPQTNPLKGSSVQSFDVVSYLPARLSTWAVAGLATFVKPSAYPTR